MNVTAQKVQGVSHWLSRRAPCEDAGMVRSMGSVSVAAICDGASCCRLGRQTAQALCAEVTLLVLMRIGGLMRMTNEELRRVILRCIRQAQRRVIAMYGGTPADCGCTLSLAAADKAQGTYLAIQLGDGAVIGRRAGDGALFQLTRPDKGQSAHATWLTVHSDEEILRHLQIARGRGLDDFFCTSDGLEGIFYALNGDVAPEVGDLLEALGSSPQAGERLIKAIACSPYQPDDDVSFAAMAGASRLRRAPLPALRRKMLAGGKVRRRGERPRTVIAVQRSAQMNA